MNLDFNGFIDADFESIPANQISVIGGSYVDGIWIPGAENPSPYTVNIQPVNNREIQSLNIGGERISDYRVIHVNNGDFHALSPDAFWEFDANNRGVERYKVIDSDIRVWRSFGYIVVCLIDGAPNV